MRSHSVACGIAAQRQSGMQSAMQSFSAAHINGHREQSKVHKQIRPFSAPVHAGARRSISVLVGCGILTLPDEKNSLAKPTALHRGGEIEQMKKCFLDTTA